MVLVRVRLPHRGKLNRGTAATEQTEQMKYNIEVKQNIRSWKRGLVKSEKFTESIRVYEVESGHTMAYCPDMDTARLVLAAIEIFRAISEDEIDVAPSRDGELERRLTEIVHGPPPLPSKSFKQRLDEKHQERINKLTNPGDSGN